MSTSRQKRVISEVDNPQDNEGEMVPPRQKKSRGSSSGETGDFTGQGLSRGRKLLKREGAPASSATATAISDKNEADAKTKCKATKKVPDTLANKVTRSTAKASSSTKKNTYEQEIINRISKKQEAKTKTVRKMKIKESAAEVLTPQQRSVIEASPRLKNYTIPKKTPVPDKTLNLKHDPLLPQPVVTRDSSYSGMPKKTTFGDQIKTVKSLLDSSVNKKRNKRSAHEETDQVTANDGHLTKVRQSKKIKHHTLESSSTEKPKINCSIPGTLCALNESIPSSSMGTKKNTPLPNDEGKQKTTSKSEINNCQDEKLLQVETTLSEEMDYDTTVPEIYQMVAEANALQPIQNDFYAFDAMEVDLAEVAANAKDQPLLMLIADTNVWISNMSIIGQILKTLDASVNILIPWMVLQEIDYNIHSNKASNKRREFQSAAKYIHSLLCLKDPRIRGQKAAEAIIGMEFNELMADDSILNCVLQCHKQTQFITVFLTNDINLLNKALIHDINAFKVDTKIVDKLQQLASVDPSQTNSFEKDYISFQSPSQTVQTMNPNPGEVVPDYNRGGPAHIETDENVMDVDDPNGTVPSCNDAQIQNLPSTSPNNSTIIPTFDIIADNLRKSLTHIIVPNMAKEYGDGELGWRFAIKVKPPFSVESGLKCLQVHWIAVFSFLFPQRGKDVVDELLATFSKKPNPVNEEEIVSWRLNICKMALTLFSMNPDLVKSERIAETVMFLKAYIDNADNGQ